MKNDRTLSFAAIVTTSSSPEEGDVLEAAAVTMRGGEEIERFSELADARPLPLSTKKLTGIDEARVVDHRKPKEVLRRLLDFVSGTQTVVHGAPRFEKFVRSASLRPPEPLLDSAALARAVEPESPDYWLDTLADRLELEGNRRHRALSRAILTAELWRKLSAKMVDLPESVLSLMWRLCEYASHPLTGEVKRAANRKMGFDLSSGKVPPLKAALPDFRELFKKAQNYESPTPSDDPLPTDEICHLFQPEAAVGRNLGGYEHRPEQVSMARQVCQALNEGRHLLVEAGTGTGKSMAYLLPAIAWACQNDDKVVVSTNTKNLQEQLYKKDLPFLEKLFSDKFKAALLKGRANYLCARRFLHLATRFERELSDPRQAAALLPLVVWATRTETGDLAECTGFFSSRWAPSLIQHIVSRSGECAGQGCPQRRSCFVRKARTQAELSDLIVVNHALLFSSLGLDKPILPMHRTVIFDEAHNVEEAATSAMAVTVDSLSVFRITNRLYRKRGDESGSGMLATVMFEVDRGLPESMADQQEDIKKGVSRVIDRIDRTVEATRRFFDTLAAPFSHLPRYENKVMLDECKPPVGPGSATWDAAGELSKSMISLAEEIQKVAEELEEYDKQLGNAQELADDLRSQAERLTEVSEQLEFVLERGEDDFVYWLERSSGRQRTFYSLHAAPLEIGRYMRTFFLNELRSVLFASATLKVGGSFQYMLERLGAEEVDKEKIECMELGSSFDYDEQSLVCAATFLPDPGGRRDRVYDDELSSFLIDLLKATRGRALVLSTSYSLLNSAYETIKTPLEKAGIMVLAQGRSGSRAAITELFRKVSASVLLGTQSFWEGVDIAGDTLSCLLLTKLPFHPIGDPLVKGRTEYLRSQGRDPFGHYTLPNAVIRFRQGFGRLIRHRTDRGVIVVTDRRLATRSYGRAFLQDIPTECRMFRRSEDLVGTVARFLDY